MLKPVSIGKSVLAYRADCPADNQARQLALFLYGTFYAILKKLIVISITVLFFTSCKEEERKNIEISEEFKIQFLNEILSETTDLKILTSKSQLISNYPVLVPPYLPPDPQNPKKSISHTEYIAQSLGVKDTNFIRQQFVDNRKLDLNLLKNYGFKIFDFESQIKSGISYNQILEKVDSINEGTDNYSLLKISKPFFNKERNKVYIRLGQGSEGETLILKRTDGVWKREQQLDKWVE